MPVERWCEGPRRGLAQMRGLAGSWFFLSSIQALKPSQRGLREVLFAADALKLGAFLLFFNKYISFFGNYF